MLNKVKKALLRHCIKQRLAQIEKRVKEGKEIRLTWLEKQMLRRKLKETEVGMIILKILAWVVKNMAYIIGIMDTIVKLIAGIVSLTPTKKDDKLRNSVDTFFNFIKGWLYKISDLLGGK